MKIFTCMKLTHIIISVCVFGLVSRYEQERRKKKTNLYTKCVCVVHLHYSAQLSIFNIEKHVCVVHLHCSAQLSMFNMEKRYRNKIIFIIIIIKAK